MKHSESLSGLQSIARNHPAGRVVTVSFETSEDAAAFEQRALSVANKKSPEQSDQIPSPTAGMSMAQRILHVGGRNNAAGYVEFGSIQAVEALVRQVIRDMPQPGIKFNEGSHQEREVRLAAEQQKKSPEQSDQTQQPAQPARELLTPEWYSLWIRNNHQNYWNITALREAMTKAAHGITKGNT